MFRADVHCHTTFSDGTVEPKALVQMALRLGLQGLSFTDHDDVGAYRQTHAYAQEMGLELASGVELSCLERKESVHILGYGFDIEPMAKVCSSYKELREKRNTLMLERLAELGMPIDRGELLAVGSLGRPQIASAMVKKGYVHSFREAFDKWIGDTKPGFVHVDRYSVQEGIEQIHSCGGLAVLAHPHLIDKKSLLEQVLSYDFDGIEGRYGTFSAERSAPFVKIGEERRWLVTGGSDFHGDIKPLGCLGNSWTSEEVFRRLQRGRGA